MPRFLTAAAMLFLLLTVDAADAGMIAGGSIVDPAGDSTGVDIVSASVVVDSGGAVAFSVTFAPGTSLGVAAATFNLDLDQDPSTGFPGVNNGGSDGSLIGTDYLVRIFGADFEANAQIVRILGNGSSFEIVETVAVLYAGTTATAVSSLATLGDDGLLNFKVVSQTQIQNGAFTTIQDYATDLGSPVGVVAVAPVPEPGSLALAGIGALVLSTYARRPGRPRPSALA